MTTDSTDVYNVDAGDDITLSITAHHLPNPSISAFRLHLSIFYPTTSLVFLGARLTLATGAAVSTTVNMSNETIQFAVPELDPLDEALVVMEFMLPGDVQSGKVIPVPRVLLWCSQSDMFPGGRKYSTSGDQKAWLLFEMCNNK